MSVVARLEVIPTTEPSMSSAVASAVAALDQFDVSYETTPTDTIIEADDPAEVFAAAAAAHRAVADERVVTELAVDDQRARSQRRHDRVASVERRLGRPAKRERATGSGGRGQTSGTRTSANQTPASQTSNRTPANRNPSESRYLRAKQPISQ